MAFLNNGKNKNLTKDDVSDPVSFDAVDSEASPDQSTVVSEEDDFACFDGRKRTSTLRRASLSFSIPKILSSGERLSSDRYEQNEDVISLEGGGEGCRRSSVVLERLPGIGRKDRISISSIDLNQFPLDLKRDALEAERLYVSVQV